VDGVAPLLSNAAARDFVADAFAHLKFVAFVKAALPLFEKAGIAKDMDQGFIQLGNTQSVSQFVTACRKLRVWEREQVVVT
jgi:catalase